MQVDISYSVVFADYTPKFRLIDRTSDPNLMDSNKEYEASLSGGLIYPVCYSRRCSSQHPSAKIGPRLKYPMHARSRAMRVDSCIFQ